MVLQETKGWVTEFQNSIALLDKEVGARLDALKSQVEKAAQTQAAIAQPGSIELTVTNSDKADGFAFDCLNGGFGRQGGTREKSRTRRSGSRLTCLPASTKLLSQRNLEPCHLLRFNENGSSGIRTFPAHRCTASLKRDHPVVPTDAQVFVSGTKTARQDKTSFGLHFGR